MEAMGFKDIKMCYQPMNFLWTSGKDFAETFAKFCIDDQDDKAFQDLCA